MQALLEHGGHRARCLVLARSRQGGLAWLDEVGAGQALIPPADLAWLRGLPEELLVTERVWVCHGMPGNPWNSIWPRSPIFDANVSDQFTYRTGLPDEPLE